MIHANIYFEKTPTGGLSALLNLLRDCGARKIGTVECARVPIDIALESNLLDYATHLEVRDDDGSWSAILTVTPQCGLVTRWQSDDGDPQRASSFIESISTLAELDFAVIVAGEPDATSKTLENYRRLVLARCPPEVYARQGPAGCGDQTWIGTRLLSLLPDDARRDLSASAGHTRNGPLVLRSGDEAAGRACNLLATNGLMTQFEPRGSRFHATRGTLWRPPEPTPHPDVLGPETRDVLQRLQSSVKGGTAADIQIHGFVAPFAVLHGVHAERLEAEHAVLAFARLDNSVLEDAGLVEADLRGASARGSRWVEVSLHSADLRWADLSRSALPLSRLDEADCSCIDLTDSSALESAVSATFDYARADRWAPGPNSALANASFRNASLQHANFQGADLRNAIFDRADLTGVNFQDADLRGASFHSAVVEGVNLANAKLDAKGLQTQ